jgi:ribosome-binding protein aMBF1 (putative translation factor)
MTMKRSKRERLEAAGWRVGTAAEFLGLTKEEAAFVEMKLALADGVKRRRQAKRLTQLQLAQRIGSSQSRVAKIESADPTVSIDLLVRTLLAMGASRAEVARVISRGSRRRAA